MSNRNIESDAFQYEADDDRRAEHETNLASLQADADYAEQCERQRRDDLEAQAEYDRLHRDADGTPIALPALSPVTARCNAVPAQPLAHLAGVFDRPVRSVAQRVAAAIEAL